MRMIDKDEVGLKEKPEDTRYIKKLHQNETRSTGRAGKKELDPNYWGGGGGCQNCIVQMLYDSHCIVHIS